MSFEKWTRLHDSLHELELDHAKCKKENKDLFDSLWRASEKIRQLNMIIEVNKSELESRNRFISLYQAIAKNLSDRAIELEAENIELRKNQKKKRKHKKEKHHDD